MEMTLNRTIFKHYEDDLKGSSIVPIAFPLIAGSGTLTTLLSLRADYHLINIIIGILINLLHFLHGVGSDSFYFLIY